MNEEKREKKLTLVKKIGGISLWIFCIVGISILFLKTLDRHKHLTCSRIDLRLENSEGFIEGKSFINALENQFKVINKPCESINLLEIESFLKKNAYIKKVDLYFDLVGVLHLSVWQKQPVLSVTNLYGLSYMIDDTGLKMPFSDQWSNRTIQISGKVQEKYVHADHLTSNPGSGEDSLQSKELKMVFAFWKNIEKGLFSKSIKSVEVQGEDNMVLQMRSINTPIVFGDTSSMTEQLDRLDILLSTILPKTGLEVYSKIDIRFDKQFVCERKTETKELDTTKAQLKIINQL